MKEIQMKVVGAREAFAAVIPEGKIGIHFVNHYRGIDDSDLAIVMGRQFTRIAQAVGKVEAFNFFSTLSMPEGMILFESKADAEEYLSKVYLEENKPVFFAEILPEDVEIENVFR